MDWLKSLLQSYPGSRWGNRETRGLDTAFASDTYVPTALEESLLEAIRTARVRLVILCGNAGDGKTALLQHLALELGLGRHRSVDRILEGRVPNGPRVRMNLDGSAAWQGKSADELLDEFLAPFQDGPPRDNIVHLLAINDGRLLEWIEGVEERLGGETDLTSKLYELLQGKAVEQDSHIRFISLNQRSLVGGITPDGTDIDTEFLERLLDHLIWWQESSGNLVSVSRRALRRNAVTSFRQRGCLDLIRFRQPFRSMSGSEHDSGCSRHCRPSICVARHTSRFESFEQHWSTCCSAFISVTTTTLGNTSTIGDRCRTGTGRLRQIRRRDRAKCCGNWLALTRRSNRIRRSTGICSASR